MKESKGGGCLWTLCVMLFWLMFWWVLLSIKFLIWFFKFLFGESEYKSLKFIVTGIIMILVFVVNLCKFLTGTGSEQYLTEEGMIGSFVLWVGGGLVFILVSRKYRDYSIIELIKELISDFRETRRSSNKDTVTEPVPQSEIPKEDSAMKASANEIIICKSCGARNKLQIGKICKCEYCDSYLV